MSVPALPRDAKSWLVENTVNRILRFLNPGFGASNAGKVLTSNSTGTDLVWQIPTLSYLTNSLAADVALNVTSTWFDGPAVAQGTTGVFLVIGDVIFEGTSNDGVIARIWDGTNVYKEAVASIAAVGNITVSLSAIVVNPAGNLRIAGENITSATSVLRATLFTSGKASSINVVRIG